MGKDCLELEEWNDHGHREKGKSLGGLKHSLVLGEDRLDVGMDRGCFNHLNGMKLGDNARMTFSKELFHSAGVDDLW